MKIINIILFIALLPISVLNIKANAPDAGGILKGIINDATSSIPVEYATIAVYSASDNNLINERFALNLLSWNHSGFSINNDVKISLIRSYENG